MSEKEIKTAQARRRAREQKQAQAERSAREEAVETANAAKPAAKTVDASRQAEKAHIDEPMQRVTSDTRSKKKLARAAAERNARAQAAKDALAMPPPPEDVLNGTPIGGTPPLHVLNARAKEIENVERKEATELATQIGKSARDILSGRDLRGRHQRRRQQGMIEAAARGGQK